MPTRSITLTCDLPFLQDLHCKNVPFSTWAPTSDAPTVNREQVENHYSMLGPKYQSLRSAHAGWAVLVQLFEVSPNHIRTFLSASFAASNVE